MFFAYLLRVHMVASCSLHFPPLCVCVCACVRPNSLCGFPPFYDENNAALFAQIKTASFDFPSPFWDDVSDLAKDLVRKLLVVDIAKRLSATDVLKHPWVRDGGSEAQLDREV